MGNSLIKVRISKLYYYLIIAAILIDSETMYRQLTNSPLYGKGFGWAMGIACFLYVVSSKKLKVDTKLTIMFPTLLMYLTIYIALSRYNVQRFLVGYVGVFCCMYILAYCLWRNNQLEDFLKAYSNTMFIISVVSLFFWGFGSLMNILPGRTMTTYYWAEKIRTSYTYLYLYFENPTQNIAHNTICNLGVFTEAPGYSGFLTYGLLVELVFRKKLKVKKELRINTFKIIIYVFTLITTNSTKGILAIMIAMFIEYLFKSVKHRYTYAIKIVLGAALLAVVAIAGTIILEGKLITTSGIVRMDDMIAGFKTFIQHPLIGAGYENVDAIVKNQLVTRSNKGLSMGLSVILAYGGVWLFSLYLGALIVSYRSNTTRQHRKTWFLVSAVLTYNVFVSNSGFSDPYLFIIAMAYTKPFIYNDHYSVK